jgi:ATP-dependent Clp protease ATP-binding subunit ClpA
MVAFTETAGHVSALAQLEARRLQHHYLGSEHLLLGLLIHDDNLAAQVLRTHGLDLATVRAEVNRLITKGVLPGPQPDDSELLATIGVDLEAVHGRLKATFGDQAYWKAAQRVQHRPTGAVTHRAVGAPPLTMSRRALGFAADEAIARDQEIGPELLLLGLLREAKDPVETNLYAQERRQRGLLGLPEHGPYPVRLLVEARGLTLEALQAALLSQLDPNR